MRTIFRSWQRGQINSTDSMKLDNLSEVNASETKSKKEKSKVETTAAAVVERI